MINYREIPTLFLHKCVFIILFIGFIFLNFGYTQTTLSPGDILLVTLNADGNDNFDFVPLVSLEANTAIFFTDNAWDGSAIKSNEGTLKYIASTSVSSGTIVSYSGTVEGEWSIEDAGFNISGIGDNIIVFQGSTVSPIFIHGVGWAKTTNWISTGTVTANNSYIPLGLSVSNNTIISLGTADNYQYVTSNGTSGPKSTLRYWTSQSGNYNSNSSTAYSALSGSFSVGCIISGTSGFRMMSSPVAGQIYSDLLSELFTQGMTGSDSPSAGLANVWTLNVSGQSWTSLSDISSSGDSQTAGTGFLVYVFADTDNDGTDDLPVTLSVSGTENSSSASITSIADGNWALAGNPYASTIDWDLVTKTSLLATTSVWDDASSAYKSWNGTTGSLTDGLIAPYQGFWIQASGATGSMTIETADKSSVAGTFYRTTDNDHTGSFSLTVSSDNYSDQTYVSFMETGETGMDNADGYKLLPISPSERIVALSYTNETGLDINNLPFEGEGTIEIPFDVMKLTVNEDYHFVTNEEELSMTWDLDPLPETITRLILTNNQTGEVTDLLIQNELSFFTQVKGSFPSYGNESVNIYPLVGESQFTLTIEYTALSTQDHTLPTKYALHPVYPNPFNPSTMISFDVPNMETLLITSLQIFNIKGQWVETLINKPMKPGNHQIQWNPVNLSSGTYLVKLKSGEKTFTQKITYIK